MLLLRINIKLFSWSRHRRQTRQAALEIAVGGIVADGIVPGRGIGAEIPGVLQLRDLLGKGTSADRGIGCNGGHLLGVVSALAAVAVQRVQTIIPGIAIN